MRQTIQCTLHQGEDIVVVEKGWLCTIHKKLLEQQEG
jgi:hypothetical protein